jgi:hypothetical protein
MRHAHSSIFERVSKALHAQYDGIVEQPLPERWSASLRNRTLRGVAIAHVQIKATAHLRLSALAGSATFQTFAS